MKLGSEPNFLYHLVSRLKLVAGKWDPTPNSLHLWSALMPSIRFSPQAGGGKLGSDPKFTAPVVCVDAFNPVLATGWRQEIRGQLKFTAPVVCVDAFNSAHAGLCQPGPCQLPWRKYSPSAPCPVELYRPSGAVILGSDPNCAATRSQQTAAPNAIGLRPQYHGPEAQHHQKS